MLMGASSRSNPVIYLRVAGRHDGRRRYVDTDPLFVRLPDDGGNGWGDKSNTQEIDEGANNDYGDLRLQSGSLCIDAGDNLALDPAMHMTDLARSVAIR